MEFKSFLLPLSIAFFLLYETAAPFYSFEMNRLNHIFVNISAGLIAFVTNILIFYFLSTQALSIDKGLADLFPSDILKIAFAVILFDLWMYIWHRMNHEIRFFWRFHKAHHADTAMDATTGVRFHPVEVVLSTGVRLPVYILLGINPYIIALYESMMAVVVIFHHSNIRLPLKIDDALSIVFPTPRMHRVHHSPVKEETNSNYGTVFSLWDRLFGTFNSRRDVENIDIGLDEYRYDMDKTLTGFLKIPLRG